MIFEIIKMPITLHLLLSSSSSFGFARLELTESRYQHNKHDMFLKYSYPGLCDIKIFAL